MPPATVSRRGQSSNIPASAGPKILTFALYPPPRPRRKRGPKVKTGCITCKRRHIKCDETKPSCQRCLKLQGHCDGYEASVPSDASCSSLAESSLSPSPSSADIAFKYSLSPTCIEPNFNTGLLGPGVEASYFKQWLALTPNLAGWIKSRLWTETLPQLCKQEPSVYLAAVAVGAMARASLPTVDEVPASLIQLHYGNALTYYGQALRTTIGRPQKQDDESSIRTALHSCLLFVCFEVLHGNCELALNHTTNGLQILKQNHLSLEFDKNEIMQTFYRIKIVTLSMCLTQRRLGKITPANTAGSYPSIPPSFADLRNAREWWSIVRYRMLELEAHVSRHLETAGAPNLYVPGIAEWRQEHVAYLEAWDAAFQPLYCAAVQSESKDEEKYLMCVSMRFQYVQHWISARSMYFSTDVLDRLTGQFRELNQLAGILLPRQRSIAGFSGAFSLDVVPTLGLQITSTRCRDATVRDEALQLLSAYPRRDCFWDSHAPNFWARSHVLS